MGGSLAKSSADDEHSPASFSFLLSFYVKRVPVSLPPNIDAPPKRLPLPALLLSLSTILELFYLADSLAFESVAFSAGFAANRLVGVVEAAKRLVGGFVLSF